MFLGINSKGADDSSSSNNVLAGIKIVPFTHADVINSCIIQESDADEALTKVCHDQDQPGMTFIFLICIHTNLSCLYCMHTQPSTLTKVSLT